MGEAWHNYHHIFPWDYKAAELGSYSWNFSTAVIDFFAKIGNNYNCPLFTIIFKILISGWEYDLKYVSNEMICKRALRTGDGSFEMKKFKGVDMNSVTEEDFNVDHKDMIWGWKDPNMSENAKSFASVINPVDD